MRKTCKKQTKAWWSASNKGENRLFNSSSSCKPATPSPPVQAMATGTACEATAAPPLRVFFIPFFSHSHALPMAELAYQFAARGVDSTMLITPADGAPIRPTVERAARAGLPLRLLHFPFPSAEVGLDAEDDAVIHASEIHKLLAAAAVRDTHARILREHRPDAVVADFCYRWANDVADDLGIPRVFFDVAGAFPNAVLNSLIEHRPQDGIAIAAADGEEDMTPFLRVGVRTWEGFHRNLMREAEEGAAERALVKGEDIARVVSRFGAPGLADEEVEGMRRRAGEFREKLRAALRRGGSSCRDLGRLIDELRAFRRGGDD